MRSYWHTKTLSFPDRLPGRITADVAVIGAGFAGLWFAHMASRRGIRVVVLDAEAPGYGASGRNGGLMTGGLALSPSDAVQQWGEALALNLYHRVVRAQQAIQEAAAQAMGVSDFKPDGCLVLPADETEWQKLKESAAWLARHGLPGGIVSGQDLPQILKDYWPGGLVYPTDGSWQPMKLVRWLVRAIQSRGGEIYGRAAVRSIQEESGGVEVRTDQGQVVADYAVLAVNASLGWLVPSLADAVVPTRGQMLVSEPIDPLPYTWAVSADWGYLYWHQRPDGRIALGGFRNLDIDGEGSDELALNPRIQEELSRWLADRIVGRPVAVDYRWAGIMGFTPDRLPLVGPWTARQLVLAGFNGHGSTNTYMAAEHLLRAMAGEEDWLAPLSPRRFSRTKRDNPCKR